MRISVIVKSGSKNPGIEIISKSEWVVRVRAQATEGKANLAVLEAIAEKLNLPNTEVILVKGVKSKLKTIEIP